MDGFTGTHLRDPNRDEHPFWQWPGALDGQDVNASWNVTHSVPVGPDLLLRDITMTFPGGGKANAWVRTQTSFLPGVGRQALPT